MSPEAADDSVDEKSASANLSIAMLKAEFAFFTPPRDR